MWGLLLALIVHTSRPGPVVHPRVTSLSCWDQPGYGWTSSQPAHGRGRLHHHPATCYQLSTVLPSGAVIIT